MDNCFRTSIRFFLYLPVQCCSGRWRSSWSAACRRCRRRRTSTKSSSLTTRWRRTPTPRSATPTNPVPAPRSRTRPTSTPASSLSARNRVRFLLLLFLFFYFYPRLPVLLLALTIFFSFGGSTWFFFTFCGRNISSHLHCYYFSIFTHFTFVLWNEVLSKRVSGFVWSPEGIFLCFLLFCRPKCSSWFGFRDITKFYRLSESQIISFPFQLSAFFFMNRIVHRLSSAVSNRTFFSFLSNLAFFFVVSSFVQGNES